MYKLWIGNKNYSSWSLRPWLLLTKLRIPFEEALEPFIDAPVQEDFKRFSPTGKVPCLVDDTRTIWDSLAITEYVAELHDGIWPVDPDARAWARCISAEMHSSFQALRGSTPMNVALRVKMNPPSDALKRDISRINEIWTESLKRFGGKYLCGNTFTAADAFFAPVAFRWQSFGFVLEGAAEEYARTMLAEPAMLSWQQAALAEVWQDKSHEDECTAAGTIIEDLRNAFKQRV